MKKIVFFVFGLNFSVMFNPVFSGLVYAQEAATIEQERASRKQELHLPFFMNNKAKKIGCSGIKDYFENENNIYPPFEKISKSFWCQDDKTGKYTLVIDAHPDSGRIEDKCPMIVVSGQDRPTALWSYHHERTNKKGQLNEMEIAQSGFQGLDGKPRNGKFFDYQYIASYQGKGYAYICYKNEWLRKKSGKRMGTQNQKLIDRFVIKGIHFNVVPTQMSH